MLKRFMFISLFVLLALPLMAQEKGGSTYIFRFVPGKDMFFTPYRQNGSELQRLSDTLNVCIQQLKDEQMYINVSCYATSSTGSLPAGRMAYLRNNRVRAELITRLGLKEKMFVTDRIIPNGYGANNLHDVVVVIFPANVTKVAQVAGEKAAMRVQAYNREMFANSETGRQMAEQKQPPVAHPSLRRKHKGKRFPTLFRVANALFLMPPDIQQHPFPFVPICYAGLRLPRDGSPPLDYFIL